MVFDTFFDRNGVLGPLGVLLGVFWELLGPPGWSFSRFFADSLKTWNFAYLTTHSNDFRASGGAILEPFSAQNVTEKRLRLEVVPSDRKII